MVMVLVRTDSLGDVPPPMCPRSRAGMETAVWVAVRSPLNVNADVLRRQGDR